MNHASHASLGAPSSGAALRRTEAGLEPGAPRGRADVATACFSKLLGTRVGLGLAQDRLMVGRR